ncbi:MAG: hypothetical protein LBI87_13090 [Candidatus Accumulibacter sp.]|jgi:hypothetical protein|nr:hypothetical protein [Accumulibacter sp.]
MSVSIALLPVALALWTVMSAENFKNWSEAQQVRVPSSFKTEAELVRVVKKAGYDVIRQGGLLKTHLDGEKNFFFWECVDGKWIAVFSKSHEQTMLNKFTTAVEATAGRKVFDALPNTAPTASAQFPTNFRDGEMLIDALKEFGANPIKRSNSSIVCRIGQSELLFAQVGNAPFTVEVKNAPNLEQVYQYLSGVDEDYKRCVQTAVYEKVKARAAEKGMVVEDDEVLPDKTIVMTLRLK